MSNAITEPHRLTDVDVDARTATCSVCGPTTLQFAGKRTRRGAQCGIARNAHRRALRAIAMPALPAVALSELLADRRTPALETRFFSYVTAADCWEWDGRKFKGKYGRFEFLGRRYFAHRFVWEYLVGAIPDELQVDHRCFNTLCVNPDHLEVVTQEVNRQRQRRLLMIASNSLRKKVASVA